MATSIVLDLTSKMNADSQVVIDTNGWDFVIAQIVTPSGAISFTGTNDGGDTHGSTLGNQLSAANFATVSGIDMSSTTPATYITSANASKGVKFKVPMRYLKLAGTSVTVAKLIVKLHKHF